MGKLSLGGLGLSVALVVFLWWRWDVADARADQAEERAEEYAGAVERLEAQAKEAEDRRRREAEALAEARERRDELAATLEDARARADDLQHEAEKRDAQPVDPWDCAVTPVPSDWIPERWQP